ncbi:MAG: response regulator, partial [Desulfamplus sp.]|nr:response regulator [Desulfamplus sp.]
MKPNILIVDDNPFNRLYITELLNAEGFVVEEAINGKEALLKLNKSDFKLIIMDLLMPGMDGFETVKKIRELGLTIPIVAVSALALKQDRQRSLRAGCNDFVPKPVDFQQLRSIIEKYLKEPSNSKDNHNAKEDYNIYQNSNKEAFNKSSSQVDEPSFDKSCPFKGYSLLLVEEDKQLRDSYSDFLIQVGFEVYSVSNGSEALKFIEENSDKILDIIVSNIFTSGIDGLGLLTIIKRQFAHILVFLYTQSYDPSTFQYAVQQKVDGIIPQAQITKNNAIEIIESALSQLMLKGSRVSDAKTASLVRQ